MSEQSLREALAEQLYGEVWSEKPWSEATQQEKALCYKAAQRFEQIIAEHASRPLLDREAVKLAFRRVSLIDKPPAQIDNEITDAVMDLARPMPTEAEIAERVRLIFIDGGAARTHAQEAASEIADAVLSLLNGTR